MKSQAWVIAVCLLIVPGMAAADGAFYEYDYLWDMNKLSATGETLWGLSQNWIELEDGSCKVASFVSSAMDGEENIYILGNNGCNSEDGDVGLGLVKMNPEGKAIWFKETQDVMRPAAMAVDEAGNSFIAGPEMIAAPFPQFAKYDPQGNLQWHSVNKDSFGAGRVVSVLLDQNGNSVIIGNIREESFSDIWLRKYDPAGRILWTVVYGEPNVLEKAIAALIDEEGRVILAGNADSSVFCLQFDVDGNLLWDNRYIPEESNKNHFKQLIEDPTGYFSLYFANSDSSDNKSHYLLNINESGQTVWQQLVETSPRVIDRLGADNNGDIYIILHGDDNGYHFALVKYDSNGNRLLEKELNNVFSFYEYSNFAMSEKGDFAIVYQTQNLGTMIAKYDNSGSLVWHKSYYEELENKYYKTMASIDSEENIYLIFDYWKETVTDGDDTYWGGDDTEIDDDMIDDDIVVPDDDASPEQNNCTEFCKRVQFCAQTQAIINGTDYQSCAEACSHIDNSVVACVNQANGCADLKQCLNQKSDDDDDDDNDSGCAVGTSDPAAPLVAVMLLIGLIAMAVSLRKK